MTMSSISDDIHEDVLLELHAIVDCELDDLIYAFRLICVHVDYRALS